MMCDRDEATGSGEHRIPAFSDVLHAAAHHIEGVPVLAIQPFPADTRVSRLRVGTRIATAIYRTWRPGDAARCRLCRRCTARDNGCLILTDVAVSDDSAPLFATVGLRANAALRAEGCLGILRG